MAKIDEKLVVKTLKDMHKDIDWISKNYREIQKKYGGKFVAIDQCKVVFADKDFKIVHDKIKREPSDPTEPWIDYIPDENEPDIIYTQR